MKRSASLGVAFLAVLACAWSLQALAQSTGSAKNGATEYKTLGCNQCHGPDPRIGDATVGTTNPVLLSGARDPTWIDYSLNFFTPPAYAQSIDSMPNVAKLLGDIAEFIYACKITPLPAACDLTEGGGGGGGGGGGATNYGGLWWVSTESGWGVNFAHQGNQIFATWYTYDLQGKAWWLSMLATQGTNGTFTGNILASHGLGLNNPSPAPATPVGTGSISFSDPSNGTFNYTLTGYAQQTKSITKYRYSTVPTCTYSAQPNFTSAGNYQDLWWVPAESGWGMNVTHQGTSQIFVTWYTFDVDGTVLWLSTLATQSVVAGPFTGPVNRTSGTTWNNFNAAAVQTLPAGTASFTFPDGNHMNLNASIQLSGMATATPITKQLTRFLFAAPAGTLCQ